ncbi:MAG: c-type cytochrome, partial [Flavisolibacter sp.]
MNLLKIIAKNSVLPGLFLLFSLTVNAQQGQQIFQQNCQSCHALDKVVTGPALRGVTERGPWAEDRANLVKWVHGPGAFIPTTPYTTALQKTYGQIMPSFPQLSKEEILSIFDWIEKAPAAGTPAPGATAAAEGEGESSGRNALIFGVISLILAIVALILMQVNSNLKKLSDDKERILRPEAVPFWRNKIYIALVAIVFFIIGGFFVGKGAIGL